MHIKTQKFLVVGASKSGYSATKYILNNGGECYIYEELKSAKIDGVIGDLVKLGAKRVLFTEAVNLLEEIDVLILSPGVPINHELAVNAKEKGVRIVGELEFGFLQFSPPIVAVTGTNGKTTTVNLIDAILKEANIKSQMVGNVGVPITSKLEETYNDTVCVTEVSSFQLESINAFCPHISCVLNIAPDHLERHYTMENYVFLKKRILKNQRESEYAILNFDDKTVKEFSNDTRANIVWVSTKSPVDGGYCIDGKIYFYDEYIIDTSSLKLKGEHNIYNTLFSVCSCKLLGVKTESIVSALKNFKGVKHRIEHVLTKKGVDIYNDSKATNTASTLSALETMTKPTVLILGGSEKGEDYFNLFEKIKSSCVKHAVLTGASRFNMLDSAGKAGYSNVTVTSDFTNAVKIALMLSNEGDNLLLSPACASYDRFSGYEERGETFVKIVEAL